MTAPAREQPVENFLAEGQQPGIQRSEGSLAHQRPPSVRGAGMDMCADRPWRVRQVPTVLLNSECSEGVAACGGWRAVQAERWRRAVAASKLTSHNIG